MLGVASTRLLALLLGGHVLLLHGVRLRVVAILVFFVVVVVVVVTTLVVVVMGHEKRIKRVGRRGNVYMAMASKVCELVISTNDNGCEVVEEGRR